MSYLYEMHCHTSESSRCAKISARDMVHFYKSKGYTGICITDHFIGGNTTVDPDLPWEEQVDIFFKSYEIAKDEGDKIGLQVFRGLEYPYAGTDFLVFGLAPEWLRCHPEISDMRVPHRFDLMRENGAYIFQAHPFREASYIDMIRLLPRKVDGVEVFNACGTDFANSMALQYAENYGLPKICGSDNHLGELPRLAALGLKEKAQSAEEICRLALSGNVEIIQINSDNI